MSGELIDVIGGRKSKAVQEAQAILRNAIVADNVLDMVKKVIARAGNDRKNRIRRFRLFGHGAPGYAVVGDIPATLTLSTREQEMTFYVNSSKVIYPTAFVSGKGTTLQVTCEYELKMLREYFAPDGWAELHNCYVAEGERGRALIKALASIWKVPVKGAVGEQIIGGGFEHGCVIAYPGGHIVSRSI